MRELVPEWKLLTQDHTAGMWVPCDLMRTLASSLALFSYHTSCLFCAWWSRAQHTCAG